MDNNEKQAPYSFGTVGEGCIWPIVPLIAILASLYVFFYSEPVLNSVVSPQAKSSPETESSPQKNNIPQKNSPIVNDNPKNNIPSYYDWKGIDLKGDERVKFFVEIGTKVYVGKNYQGYAKCIIPKALIGERCVVHFKRNNKEVSVYARVGDKLVLPQSLLDLDPDDYLPKNIDEIGRLAFGVPDTMYLNAWEKIKLRITADSKMVEIIDVSKSNSIAYQMEKSEVKNLKVDSLRIGLEMQAKVEGLGDFETKPITPEIQNIELGSNEFTEWIWMVRPLKPGNCSLVIDISMTKQINGESLSKSIRVYDRKISVFSNAEKSIWFILIWCLLVCLFVGFWVFLIKKRIRIKGARARSPFVWLNASEKNPKSIFICFAKEDYDWALKVYKSFVGVSKNDYILIQHEGETESGVDRIEWVKTRILISNVTILLVSSDFFASDDYDTIIKICANAVSKKQSLIVPIILKKCHWDATDIGKYPVLPTNNMAITSEWKDFDEAMFKVVEELGEIIKKYRLGLNGE